MDTINERIAWLVANNNKTKTKTDFARLINLSQPYLSQICSGDRMPSDRTISDICRVFHVDENWLRHGLGDPHSESEDIEKLNNFFADVLTSAPDARSAFILALADLPKEYWPMVADLAENYARNFKEQPPQLHPVTQKSTVAARSGDRAEVLEVSAQEEEEALSPPDSCDI